MEGKDGRTERATAKRRQEEREKGNLASSQEVISFAVLGAAFLILRWIVPFMHENLVLYMREVHRLFTAPTLTVPIVQQIFEQAALLLASMLTPLLGAVLLAVIVANLGQKGFFFELKPLAWKVSGLNPINGFKKLFSMDSLVTLGFSILKVLLIAGVLYLGLRKRLPEFTFLAQAMPIEYAVWTFGLLYSLLLKVVLLFAAVAAADYIYRYFKHERSIMMTKEEVKDERKQYEPNPIVKKNQRKKMRDLTTLRMMAAIPRANVVVTNPTHVAVALEYNPESMEAPRVVAKGLRLMAQRIKDIARENEVPIMERPELARALYKNVEVGREIPSQFYEAVAEILAHLHRLGRRIGTEEETEHSAPTAAAAMAPAT